MKTDKKDKMKISYHKMTAKHHQGIYYAMKSLGKWFDENALKSVHIDLKYHKGYIAIASLEIVGFITYFVYEGVGNIGWLGVREEKQGLGIGRKLLSLIESDFRAQGIRTVQVYTLSDSVDYEPYEKTRAFYYKNGFQEHLRVKTNNPNCPEELYLRKFLKY